MSNNKITYILPALLIAIGIALGGYFVGHALAMRQAFYRYVAVKGLAEKIVKANEADWQISFSYADDNLANVYQKIARSQTAIKAFLLKKGFTENELEVKPVAVTDNQSSGYNQNVKAKRYNGNAAIMVKTDKVDQVKNTAQNIGELVKQGIIINNTQAQYRFTKLNDIKPDMLNQATVNAEKAAKIFAKNSRSKLGAIKRAVQGLFTIQSASGNTYDESSIMKKVRVVTSVEYFLQ